MGEWRDLDPIPEGVKWYDYQLTVGRLRQALEGLPDDMKVESGYYIATGAQTDGEILDIENSE